MQRQSLILILLLLLIVFAACSGNKTEQAVTSETAPAGDAQTDAMAQKLAPAEVASTGEIDQGNPETALQSFFMMVNIALDPMYQLAGKSPEQEPERAKKYQDSLTNLRALFIDGTARTEVVAYLDLIRIKRAEVVGDPAVDGDLARITVKIFKGEGLDLDPHSFGEDSATEATVEVEMVREGGIWKIKDFGGLAAKAKANQPGTF